MSNTASNKNQPLGQALLRSGLLCRCPNCQSAPLFQGITKVHDRCINCNHNLENEDSGDGPAMALVMLEGTLFVPLVLWVHFTFLPPLWLQLIAWPLAVVFVTLLLIRPIKSVLVTIQYRLRVDNGSISSIAKDEPSA